MSRNFEDSLMAAKTQIVSFDTSCVWDDFVFRSDETVGFILSYNFSQIKKKKRLKKMNIDKKHGGNIDCILLICLS